MTDQADQKDRVRQRLERIWKFNEGILRNLDHEIRCERCERKLWDRLEDEDRRSWKCGARQRNIGPEVQDCDWPVCGCDPYASKVLDAIAESGFEIVKK